MRSFSMTIKGCSGSQEREGGREGKERRVSVSLCK
jgi:hypothetical protein